MRFLWKKTITSSHGAQKKKKQITARSFAIFFLTLVFFGAVSFLSWRPEINIQHVTIVGNTTVSEEDVRAHIEERTRGGYMYLFSRANVFLFQPRIVESELRDDFKKIQEVTVSRDSLRSLVIEISERKPFYIWCDGEVQEENGQPCYFLDINGYAFAPAPYFSGHVYFEFHKKFEAENKNPIGQFFLPEPEFKRLISFRNALKDLNLNAYALFVDKDGDYTFVTPQKTKIIFNPKQDFDLVFHNLSATFDMEQFIKKQKRGLSLLYVDARF